MMQEQFISTNSYLGGQDKQQVVLEASQSCDQPVFFDASNTRGRCVRLIALGLMLAITICLILFAVSLATPPEFALQTLVR